MALETPTPRDWRDDPDHTTPINAAAQEAIEQAAYDQIAKVALIGTGTPEGVVTARVGTAYLRTDGAGGTTLYVKYSGAGNTGWGQLAPLLSGTTGARPAAAAANAGVLYFSTTDNSYARSDGSVWVNLVPAQLGYAEGTTDFTTTSNSYVDVTGATTTVTIAGRPVMVRGHTSGLKNAGNGTYAAMQILEDGVKIHEVFAGGTPSTPAVALWPASFGRKRTPSNGAHTYKLQVISFANTNLSTVGANYWIEVVEV